MPKLDKDIMPSGASDIAWMPNIPNKPRVRKDWTAKEDTFLRENWGRGLVQDIAKALNRSATSVKAHALSLGICEQRLHWSEEEDLALAKTWPIHGSEKTAKLLVSLGYPQRTSKAIHGRANVLKLESKLRKKKSHADPAMTQALVSWQSRMHYSIAIAAEALGISETHYLNMYHGRTPVSIMVALACAAIENKIKPIS